MLLKARDLVIMEHSVPIHWMLHSWSL